MRSGSPGRGKAEVAADMKGQGYAGDVAALQAASIGAKPHLSRIETRAGHGAGKPTGKAIDETADMWAFAAHWTGLGVKPVN